MPDPDDRPVPLQTLIRDCMRVRGWTYRDLERESGDRITDGRWQQMGAGIRLIAFPQPETLVTIAETLSLDITTVVLGMAAQLGLDVRQSGPEFANLLPPGTERLTPQMRDHVLGVIREAVAEKPAAQLGQGQGAAS